MTPRNMHGPNGHLFFSSHLTSLFTGSGIPAIVRRIVSASASEEILLPVRLSLNYRGGRSKIQRLLLLRPVTVFCVTDGVSFDEDSRMSSFAANYRE